ncbi:MAG: PQQ-dependent sugar dehydrogenase [Flavisolibacter sp.]
MKQLMRFGLIGLLACFFLQSFANDSTKHFIKPGNIKLPKGFSSIIVAENLGRTRHLAVTTAGDIFVRLARPVNGKGTLILRDKNNDGVVDESSGFGRYSGTGIAIKNGYLYATSNTEVFRYKIDEAKRMIDTSSGQRIITGLVAGRQHETKSIALDNDGNIYVNVGAPSNSCQLQDRAVGSLGKDPCPLLDSTGGVWQFKADKLNQTYGDGVHYATGIRNIVGMDWNTSTNSLFVMQHGRDQLSNMFPQYFTDSMGAELPAEELMEVKKGSNFGWPYCYWDQFQNKRVLAPEYGGDGKKEGRCEGMDKPVMGFPGHLAPNGLLFYTGNMFPEKYKNGAFIAFHGSWNRAPLPQKGFFVAFVPFKNGKPSGDWEIFADNFAENDLVNSDRDAKYRPCGLAQGPDGALYVTDDTKGTIWKILYKK